MAFRIVDCHATPSLITIFFSDAAFVNAPPDPTDSHDVTNPSNYTVTCPLDAKQIKLSAAVATVSYDAVRRAAAIALSGSPAPMPRGSFLSIVVNQNVTSEAGDEFENGSNTFATRVNGEEAREARNIARATRAVEDAVSYPVLTEEVGYPPSPLATPSTTTPGAPAGTGAPLGQVVAKAVSDVLGWKAKPGDSKGFVGALNASFTCKEVEGHTECAWTPRTYAVQTDLSGGITGAQASIYSRAKEALDQSLPLLDGLYALDPEADAEDVAALKAVAKSQLTELVNELGLLGGPRVARVNQYFSLLLGATTFPTSPAPAPNSSLTPTDPDQVGGTLGNLRDELGLNFTTQDFVNSVDDEQDLSNFRVLSDYVTSLAQSWVNNLGFFGLTTTTPFFGTQLVLLSRQLSVVAESVDEVRFTLDSVFIGPAERQTLQLNFTGSDSPLFLEDLLTWIQGFASEEGPRLVQDGGKFGVQNTFLPVAQQLQRLVTEAQDPNPANAGLPRGFHTSRVQRALQELGDELTELVRLASPIRHLVTPEPDFGLPFAVDEVQPSSVFLAALPPGKGAGRKSATIFIRGSGFEAGATTTVAITGGPGPALTVSTFFRSESLLVAKFDLAATNVGTWNVTVTNADGTVSPTLQGAFTVEL